MTKPILVLYHANCIDGFTAAWAAWQTLGDEDAEYRAVNYGEPAPDVTGRDWVYVLDFAYPRAVMEAMAASVRGLVVLDHHKTNEAALAGLPFARFDMNRSGAGLAADYFAAGDSWLIDYVEDRDLWRFALPHSKEINAWIGAQIRDSFARWHELAAQGWGVAAERGRAVLQYLDRYVHDVAATARRVTFEGYPDIPIVNAAFPGISEVVGHLAESAPFAIGWAQRADGLYQYSLRSRGADGVDVSEIAKRYGGGGHKNAAGFQLAEKDMFEMRARGWLR